MWTPNLPLIKTSHWVSFLYFTRERFVEFSNIKLICMHFWRFVAINLAINLDEKFLFFCFFYEFKADIRSCELTILHVNQNVSQRQSYYYLFIDSC